MKTGAVAKRFGLDPNTITDWTDRFKEFFAAEAIPSDERKQRDYQPEDIVVLNTIRAYRARNIPWDEINVHLKGGERETNLPPEFVSIDGGSAITVYAEMREMRAKLDLAESEIERLRKKNDDDWNRMNEQMKMEREANQIRLEQLIVEKTEWRMRFQSLEKDMEQLKKELSEDEDDK